MSPVMNRSGLALFQVLAHHEDAVCATVSAAEVRLERGCPGREEAAWELVCLR